MEYIFNRAMVEYQAGDLEVWQDFANRISAADLFFDFDLGKDQNPALSRYGQNKRFRPTAAGTLLVEC